MCSEPAKTVQIVEITDPADALLLPWFDLYETAFRPEERMLVSYHLHILRKRSRGESTNTRFLAAVNEEQRLVGMAQYLDVPKAEALYLWYLAVVPDLRGRGIGSMIYREVERHARGLHRRGIIIEVEMPERARDAEHRDACERRVRFYQHLGAQLLLGVHYLQSVGRHQPKLPMHVMIQPFEPMDAARAFDFAKAVLGSSMSQSGELVFGQAPGPHRD